MLRRLRHIGRDERGMAFVYVGLGFMGFLAATTLAIDVGMFMTARSQAQNSADAGALAGAVALYYNSYTDRSSGGPAVQSALTTARANSVMRATVSVDPADVTFPLGPTGLDNRVQVTVYRTTGRTNAIPTLIGTLFGVNTVDITATAIAEVSPADTEQCVLPFTVPDRWQENTNPPFEPLTSEFDPNNDVYIPVGQPGATGYDATRDKGVELRLKSNNQNKTAPSFYNPWDLPGSTGANDYRNNIGGCNNAKITIGDLMTSEPGNMVGPTSQGMQTLVDLDPGAYWDTGCNCVKGSAFSVSPRIRPLPLYDPVYYETGKRNGRNADLKVANYLGFFVEEMQGNEVVGRISPIPGLLSPTGAPPTGAFAALIRLVQ
jgi:Flp pilus assembly protein TadG